MKKVFLICILLLNVNLDAQWNDYCFVAENEVIDVFKRTFMAEVQKENFETIAKNKIKKAICRYTENKENVFEVEFNSNGAPVKYTQFHRSKITATSNCEFSKEGRILSIHLKSPDAEALARYKYNSKGRITEITFEKDGQVFKNTVFEYDKDTILTKAVDHRAKQDITETYEYNYVKMGISIHTDNDIFGKGQIANFGNEIGFINVFDKVAYVLLSNNRIMYEMSFGLGDYSKEKYKDIIVEISENGFLSKKLIEMIKGGDHYGRKVDYDEKGLPSTGSVVTSDFNRVLTEYVYEYYD